MQTTPCFWTTLPQRFDGRATYALRSILIALVVVIPAALAQNPERGHVRRFPPQGIEISLSDRVELESQAADFARQIAAWEARAAGPSKIDQWLPDVQIYHKAVDWALRHDEFYRSNEVAVARQLIQTGRERLAALERGEAPWASATGLVVRAYPSRIDDSIQPYGLVVPASFHTNGTHRYRLDFWLHGRNEQLSELRFLHERQTSPGEFTPPNTIVAHLYGRYCNANKFAGETDLFEAWEHIRRSYPIDEDRVTVRGFSMGGAACWHLAAHHAGLWAAAAPGAGFSETGEYLRIPPHASEPPWYERTLWRLYDGPEYALNFFNTPVVAYSGELDRQKQAADVMARALAREGMNLTHIIGPQTEHRYHPEAKNEINRRIDALVAQGRPSMPEQVKFATPTLRYNTMRWVALDRLIEHWELARIEADVDRPANSVQVTTKNIAAFTLDMGAGACPLALARDVRVSVDGQWLTAPRVASDRSWTARFELEGANWKQASGGVHPEKPRVKRHGLQGPIDDAFMDRFLFVRPSGPALHAAVGEWTEAERRRATQQWRAVFRGDVLEKDDHEVTAADLATAHLVLWGDPSSNRLLGKVAGEIPFYWDSAEVRLGESAFPSSHHVPVFIYPNPLNPGRYLVVNSGFTFREADHASNARQTPKLPDYAVVDIRVPPSSRSPGKITVAGFFDEEWRLKSSP